MQYLFSRSSYNLPSMKSSSIFCLSSRPGTVWQNYACTLTPHLAFSTLQPHVLADSYSNLFERPRRSMSRRTYRVRKLPAVDRRHVKLLEVFSYHQTTQRKVIMAPKPGTSTYKPTNSTRLATMWTQYDNLGQQTTTQLNL